MAQCACCSLHLSSLASYPPVAYSRELPRLPRDIAGAHDMYLCPQTAGRVGLASHTREGQDVIRALQHRMDCLGKDPIPLRIIYGPLRFLKQDSWGLLDTELVRNVLNLSDNLA